MENVVKRMKMSADTIPVIGVHARMRSLSSFVIVLLAGVELLVTGKLMSVMPILVSMEENVWT
jgi:hypothetical protein